MRDRGLTTAAVVAAIAASVFSLTGGAQVRTPPQGVLVEPLGNAGEAVFPAFEGWGPLKDGSNVLLIGYFNRNKLQALDIPIGPDNRIEPGGPDFGQPTHFDPGRQYGVFSIQVPKDFGTKRLTWTLTANGHTSTVTFWMNPPYWIDFYKNLANGNEPPVIKFADAGPELIGPPRERFARSLTGSVGQPLTLTIWARDQPPTTNTSEGAPPAEPGRGSRTAQSRPSSDTEPPPAIIGGRVFPGGLTPLPAGGGAAARAGERRGDIRVIWKKYRGPGDVKISDEAIALMNGGDAKKFLEATTTATFSAPGEYWLRAQINDSSGDGGGGDQCCWTSAHVVVTVK
jgi:hypothetical protein